MSPILRRVVAIARVESVRLVNDRATLAMLLLLPIVQVLLYGYAIDLTPRHVPVAVAADQPAVAQPIVDMARDNPSVALTGPVGAPGSAAAAVMAGKAAIGVEASAATLTTAAKVRLIADEADPKTTGPVVTALKAEVWRGVARNSALGEPATVEVVWAHNGRVDPTVRDAWSVTPGLVGVVVMISMLFLGAFTLAREREQGSWESLLATPVRPLEALAGKLAPYLVIGFANTVVMLLAIHILFAAPLPPASWALALGSLALAAAYLILGFCFSALAQTQVQAAQAAIFVYLPSLLLSGFLFPFDGMPRWAKWIGEAMPLTHYLRATRDILIRGRGPEAMLAELGPILAFALIASVAATLAYRRRLD
ncbi:MAG: ABC transporter permease [Phenylobacterium sp.]